MGWNSPGATDSGIEQGGSGCPDIRTYLLVGGAIGPAIQVRDIGTEAMHKEGVGRIPPHGGPQDDGAAAVEGAERRLGLPPTGGCDGRGRFAGGGDLCLPPPEHSSAIYCGLVPAQDGPFFYTRSHLSALPNCAVLFSTNFQIILIFKNALHNLVIELCSALIFFQK